MARRNSVLLALLFALPLVVTVPAAQGAEPGAASPAPKSTAPPVEAAPAASTTAPRKLQPGDVLEIRVSGLKTLSGSYPVNSKGEVVFPGIGSFSVLELTADDCEAALTKYFANFFDPGDVTALLSSTRPPTISVRGLVSQSQSVDYRDGIKLLDVLASAGKLGDAADLTRIRVLRKATGKEEEFDLTAIIRDPALDPLIQAGDIVFVVPVNAGSVQIRGAVQVTGPVLVTEAPRLLAALRKARPTAQADLSKISLTRKGSAVPYLIDVSSLWKAETMAMPAAAPATTPAATTTPAPAAATPAKTEETADEGPELQDGDVIEVPGLPAAPPAPPRVRVGGAVKKKDAKGIEIGASTSLLTVLDQAELDDQADTSHVQILRPGLEPVIVDVTALQRGVGRTDDPRLQLLDGDQVFVPTAMAELRGEVTTPGAKPLNGITNIAEFLDTQGGTKPTGDRARVQIIRNGAVARVVDLTRYVRTEGVAYTHPDMELRAGDTIFVPSDESQRFVILGAVNKPGDYRALPGMTLVDALSLGDGLTKKAANRIVVIRNARSVTSGQALDKAIHFVRLTGRETVDGVVRVKYGRLVNGRADENPVINPGDAVLVPEADQLPQKLSPQDYVKKVLSLILTIKGAKAMIPLLFPL